METFLNSALLVHKEAPFRPFRPFRLWLGCGFKLAILLQVSPSKKFETFKMFF